MSFKGVRRQLSKKRLQIELLNFEQMAMQWKDVINEIKIWLAISIW